jgi:hypothetical protein
LYFVGPWTTSTNKYCSCDISMSSNDALRSCWVVVFTAWRKPRGPARTRLSRARLCATHVVLAPSKPRSISRVGAVSVCLWDPKWRRAQGRAQAAKMEACAGCPGMASAPKRRDRRRARGAGGAGLWDRQSGRLPGPPGEDQAREPRANRA